MNPKMAKKTFSTFSISAKTVYTIGTKFSGHFTPYYGPICAERSKWYDWDSSESEGKRPKETPLVLSKTS